MKLTLDNIGPLKHAEIDLSKDLIILCGPNNTGKTYAAYTAYGCYRLLKNIGGFGFTLIKKLLEIMPKLAGKIEASLSTLNTEGSVSIDWFEYYLSNKMLFQKIFSGFIKQRLYDVFDASVDFFDSGTIDVQLDDEHVLQIINLIHRDSSYRFNTTTSLEITKNANEKVVYFFLNKNSIDPHYHHIDSEITKQPLDARVNEYVSDYLMRNIYLTIFDKAYFAPAERIAINLFSSSLLFHRNKLSEQAIIAFREKKENWSELFNNQKLFPFPVRDNLEIAGLLEERQKRKSDFEYLAVEFEQEILGGKISVSQYGELQYSPKDAEITININLSASMVKSLASIVFYFRHIAQKGDFIIIDEPELNLHPDNQRKVAKLLARIVNAGFKVMISTHSDYIYRELNNQIMLNQDSDVSRVVAEKYGYKKEEILDHNKVGAYLFLPTETKSLPVTATGFEVKTIDDAIGSLNEVSMEIFTYLF